MESVLSLMSAPQNQVLLLGGLCILLLAVLLGLALRQRHLQRAFGRMTQHLQLMRQQLDTLQGRLQEAEKKVETSAEKETTGFASTLQAVEQQASVTIRPGSGSATEKYRYVSALAEQGMDAGQIAQALHIAPAEAEQAIRLAAIARSSSKVSEKSKEFQPESR